MSRRKVGARTYQRYSDETLQEAIRRVKAGEISQREASKLYQIPRSTIINKVSKKHMKSVGHPHALTPTEEKLIADRFVTVSDYGFPLTLIDAQMVVKSYLEESEHVQKQHPRYRLHELLYEAAWPGPQTGYEHQEEKGRCQQASH